MTDSEKIKTMKKCEICGKTLRKEERTVCYGCRCTQKFAKNGGNTSICRQEKAFKHLRQNATKGILTRIFGL